MKARSIALSTSLVAMLFSATALAHEPVRYDPYPGGGWSGSATVWGGSGGFSGWSGTLTYGTGFAYPVAYVPRVAYVPDHRHGPRCHHGPYGGYERAYREGYRDGKRRGHHRGHHD